MTKDMGGTATLTSDTRSAHRLGDNYRDGTMRREGAKRSTRTDKKYIGVSWRPAVLQVDN